MNFFIMLLSFTNWKKKRRRDQVSVYQQGCLNSMHKSWGCVLGLDYSIKSLVVAFWQSKSFA
jgi:hypothetical protein